MGIDVNASKVYRKIGGRTLPVETVEPRVTQKATSPSILGGAKIRVVAKLISGRATKMQYYSKSTRTYFSKHADGLFYADVPSVLAQKNFNVGSRVEAGCSCNGSKLLFEILSIT